MGLNRPGPHPIRTVSFRFPVSLLAATMLGPISSDGHGGMWIYAEDTANSQASMLHRTASGVWTTRNALRTTSLVDGLAVLPGTTSLWGAGFHASGGGEIAAIWAHGPVG